MNCLLSLTLSYLLGSFPTAYLIVRKYNHKDIRKLGSGNVGTMNVRSLMGCKASFAVFLCDAAKGILAVYLCLVFNVNPYIGLLLSVAGHIYPIWLKYRGGKGIATAFGGLLMLRQWHAMLFFILFWLIAYNFIWRRNIDFSNMAGAFGVVIYGFASGLNWGLILMAVLVFFKHYHVILDKISRKRLTG